MSTKSKHQQPAPVVSLGCGWRKPRGFFSAKQRLPLLKPAIHVHQPMDNSPSRATKQSSTDGLGPSVSSSETFARKSFCDDLSVSTDGEEATFAGLLRQLNELEQSVRALRPTHESTLLPPPEKAESGGRLGESVAVVKTSDDPLEDFRGSMLQMIVEREISTVDDLRELLHCFLSLNSSQHHAIILRAFLDIWTLHFSRSPEKIRCSGRLTAQTTTILPLGP